MSEEYAENATVPRSPPTLPEKYQQWQLVGPLPYRKSQRTLRRKQRTLSRRKKGSQRRRKAAKNMAKTHLKISRQRRDFDFKTAKPYAENYQQICVEDLNICGIMYNQKSTLAHRAKIVYAHARRD
jgi:transposase